MFVRKTANSSSRNMKLALTGMKFSATPANWNGSSERARTVSAGWCEKVSIYSRRLSRFTPRLNAGSCPRDTSLAIPGSIAPYCPAVSRATAAGRTQCPTALVNNICMSCHQTGDVRVLKPGKDYRSFGPGAALDDTMSILMVPPKRESPPQQDLLEHYYSMTLSKCYRASGQKLSCISCHDPHVEPTREEAPEYFKT